MRNGFQVDSAEPGATPLVTVVAQRPNSPGNKAAEFAAHSGTVAPGCCTLGPHDAALQLLHLDRQRLPFEARARRWRRTYKAQDANNQHEAEAAGRERQDEALCAARLCGLQALHQHGPQILRVADRFQLGEFKFADSLAHACAAGDGAVAPRGPLTPLAERRLVALTLARLGLQSRSELAWRSAVRSVMLDVAGAVPLAAALGASAPRAPVVPRAVDSTLGLQAFPGVALCHLLQGSGARLARALGLRDDAARARVLPLAARAGAIGPGAPIPEHAIHVHDLIATALCADVARSNLVLRPVTKLAVALARRHNAAVPFLPAITAAAAAAPRSPLGKRAVDGRRRARLALVAWLVLLGEALGRVAAVVCRGLHLAGAPSHAPDAGRRALLPLRPRAPNAVNANGARLRVARHDLGFVQRRAKFAEAERRHGDVASPLLRTAAA
mmetsp:Transcript_48143/g.134418  ORF Transcript_48143/g.134418 Transcript_48143/m.134418 type:complete len:443 (+) Transcript_48143:3-1331(+)